MFCKKKKNNLVTHKPISPQLSFLGLLKKLEYFPDFMEATAPPPYLFTQLVHTTQYRNKILNHQ
jgi:hypothetical protein